MIHIGSPELAALRITTLLARGLFLLIFSGKLAMNIPKRLPHECYTLHHFRNIYFAFLFLDVQKFYR